MKSLDNIKLIISDLDGTLLNSKHEVSKDLKQVMAELANKNIQFSVASGRNFHIMQPLIAELQLQLPYIANNGANIFIKDQCINEISMDNEALGRCYPFLKEQDVGYIIYTNTTLYVVNYNEGMERFLKRLKPHCEIIYDAKLDAYAKASIFKIIMVDDDEQKMIGVMDFINKEPGLRSVKSEKGIYAINHHDANKGTALKYVANYLGLDMDEIMVFGDNENDLPMLEIAGISVGMGNSEEVVKQVVDYCCDSNEHDGVVQFIKAKLVK